MIKKFINKLKFIHNEIKLHKQLHLFVYAHKGVWNNTDWLQLVDDLYKQGFVKSTTCQLELDKVGALLESCNYNYRDEVFRKQYMMLAKLDFNSKK